MRLLFLFLFFFTFLFSSFAIEIKSSVAEKSSGSYSKKELRKARKSFSKGNYSDAIKRYNELVKSDSANFDINYETGLAYYSLDNVKTRCIPHFERAIRSAEADQIGDIYFYLGRAYHLNKQYQQSIDSYNKYLNMISSNGTFLSEKVEQELIAQVKHQIVMCNNAIAAEKNQQNQIYLNGKNENFTIDKLGKEINSDEDEYSPVFSANDSLLYFVSRRAGLNTKKDWDEKHYEDIYVATRSNGEWNTAQLLSGNSNTKKHDAPNFFSNDGKKVFLYRSAKKGSIFISDVDANGNWSEPKLLDDVASMNSSKRETSISYAAYGNTLYVVSEREGGFGGRDIYKSEKDKNGNWSPLENLGAEINTAFDEDAPFISADGKTMYFSSNGHNSIGGFDVFYSKLENNKWSAPINLGYPFNSPADDIYFITDKKEETVLISSNRVQNAFSDFNIYHVSTKCRLNDSVAIEGYLADRSIKLLLSNPTDPRMNATIEVDENGKYQLNLVANQTYRLTFVHATLPRFSSDFNVVEQCEGDLYYQIIDTSSLKKANETQYTFEISNLFFDLGNASENLADRRAVLDTLNSTAKGFSKDSITLTQPNTLATTNTNTNDIVKPVINAVFANVLFDFDRASVKEEDYSNLTKLITLLKENPNKNVELSGHADAVGDAGYNLQLSKNRANAVKKYLVKNGIAANRIEITSFGENNPAQTNDTPEGRKFNRRVEIILKN